MPAARQPGSSEYDAHEQRGVLIQTRQVGIRAASRLLGAPICAGVQRQAHGDIDRRAGRVASSSHVHLGAGEPSVSAGNPAPSITQEPYTEGIYKGAGRLADPFTGDGGCPQRVGRESPGLTSFCRPFPFSTAGRGASHHCQPAVVFVLPRRRAPAPRAAAPPLAEAPGPSRPLRVVPAHRTPQG